MSFRFKTFGARGFTCQQERIDQGLVTLGGISDDLNPEFIYCNDSGYYDEAIKFKNEVAPNAKLILNVLDVPSPYVGINYDLNDLFIHLKQADIITSISEFVFGQLQHYFNLNSLIIGNPIKDINSEQRKAGIKKYKFRALFAGRVNDPFKRVALGYKALLMAGFSQNDIVIVGSENPGFGTYLGIVSDNILNDLYNSVDFVMVMSNFGGLELPIIEGIVGGALPIVTTDLPTALELCPRRWLNYSSPQCIALYIRQLIDIPELFNKEKEFLLNYGKYMAEKFGKNKIAQNILEVYNNY